MSEPFLYQIQGIVSTREVDRYGVSWNHHRSIPTFYLSPTLQGIRDESHALQIAARMLCGDASDTTFLGHAAAIPVRLIGLA